MVMYEMLSGNNLEENEMVIYNKLFNFNSERNENHRFYNDKLIRLREDCFQRYKDLKDFILTNVSIRQAGGGDIFFDPRFILSSIKKNKKKLNFDKIDKNNFDSRWKSEFKDLESVQNNWNNLTDLINEEVKELNQKLTKIKTILINFEYEGNFKETTFKNFLKDLNSLIQTSKKNDLFFSDDDIDKQVEYLEKNLGDYLNDINS